MLYNNNREYLNEVLNIAAFIVGLANYGENLDQKSAQQMLQKQSDDIHAHLKEQDRKMDLILEKLGGLENGK